MSNDSFNDTANKAQLFWLNVNFRGPAMSAVHQTGAPAHLLRGLEAKGGFSDVSPKTLPNPDLAFKMANLAIHQSEAAV